MNNESLKSASDAPERWPTYRCQANYASRMSSTVSLRILCCVISIKGKMCEVRMKKIFGYREEWKQKGEGRRIFYRPQSRPTDDGSSLRAEGRLLFDTCCVSIGFRRTSTRPRKHPVTQQGNTSLRKYRQSSPKAKTEREYAASLPLDENKNQSARQTPCGAF